MPMMSKLTKLAAIGAVAISMSACAAVSGRESVGAYVDDTVITTKVKAAIFDEPSLRSLQVNVETFQDRVQLSGFVDSPRSKAKAGEVASAVTGVRSVTNNLIVR